MKQMEFYGDYHTHTRWSDGSGSVLDNAAAACKRGIKELAITEHGFRNPSYSRNKFFKQIDSIADASNAVSGLSLLFGIEADILDERGSLDIDVDALKHIDVLIAGFHMFALPNSPRDWFRFYLPSVLNPLCKGNSQLMQRNTKALVSCVERYPVDILSHPNHRLFADMREVAKVCADKGTLIEINIKHLDSICEVMADFAAEKVNFIVNSDAHSPCEVGDLHAAKTLIDTYGIADRVVNLCTSRPIFRSHGQGIE